VARKPRVVRTSAGILLHRSSGAPLEVLLVHPGGPLWARRDAGAWSIPKGEHDEREPARDAALRELIEELGQAPVLGPLADLGEVRQASGKLVRAWAAEGDFDPHELRSNSFSMQWPPNSGRVVEFPEVDRAAWFTPAQARVALVPAQAAFIDRLVELLRVR
jgi:predicted NUDIX family NTP pyrophosphohydrolase